MASKEWEFIRAKFPEVDEMPEYLKDSIYEQHEVMLEALKIFIDKNQEHGNVWANSGWHGMLSQIRSKATRVMHKWWERKPSYSHDLDDPLDLINYTIFFIRNFRKGDRDGFFLERT